MTTPRNALAAWPGVFAAVALVLHWLAERIWSEGDARLPLLGLASALAAAALFGRGRYLWRGDDNVRGFARRWTLRAALALLGIAGYFVQGGLEAGASARTSSLLLVLSLGLLWLGTSSLAALEWVAAGMREAGVLDLARVRHAARWAWILGMTVLSVGLLNYAGHRRSARWDAVADAPTTPGAATLALLDASPRQVELFLFVERASPVQTELQSYLDALVRRGARLRVLDQAADPELARTLKVSRNGTLGLRSGERSQTLFIGTDAEAARRKYKKLDDDVRERLAKLTRDERVVYFTVGHGERAVERGGAGERVAASRLRQLLEGLNFKVAALGLAEGLASHVPDDAAALVVHGPERPFLPAEVETLRRFSEAGGSLVLLLDPLAPHGLEALLEDLTLRAPAHGLANDQEFVRVRHAPSDHRMIFATSFGSHRALRVLQGAQGRAAVLLDEAGPLVRFEAAQTPDTGASSGEPGAAGDGKRAQTKVHWLMRSRAGTFPDHNRDDRWQGDVEARGVYELAAAVERDREESRQMRTIVVGDSDMLADTLLQNEANAAFALEAILWVTHDDAGLASVDASAEAPIRHTRDEDVLWFYGTTFAAPALVLGAGLWRVRRHRRRRRREP